MERADIAAVGRMFFRTFRGRDRESPPEFNAYFARAFFGSPAYAPETGSIVHQTAEGWIDAAISAVPMNFIANGRALGGRLLCAFMEEANSRHGGAAQLMLSIRARLQDLCFTDSAAPVSADLCRAVGGAILPVQSLEWRRLFRPTRWLASAARRRFLGRTRLGLLLAPFDAALRRAFSAFVQRQPQETTGTAMTREEFLEAAPRFVSRFAIHPEWSPGELGWLLDMAALNKAEGPLVLRAVRGAQDRLIGCYLYYGLPGETAHVLNLMCIGGYETETIAQAFADLDAAGFAAARGIAQPFLMESLLRQKRTTFRYRGYFCIASRHKDVRDAAAQGDIYIGGLAGESWSRLLSDFH
ncbi:MAG: GNAT family N-acetyltransferase [Alphaproteobacteria bacterium]|nr:GNAT family N-acetyltransferase [Alphaproteobacteria bacterium]